MHVVLLQLHIILFNDIQMVLGNTHLQIMFWLIVVCPQSLHILRDAKHDYYIPMLNPRVLRINNALHPLQLGVVPTAKCGGDNSNTA